MTIPGGADDVVVENHLLVGMDDFDGLVQGQTDRPVREHFFFSIDNDG
jgi:hypothetical protein